jgi:hypothetical protein
VRIQLKEAFRRTSIWKFVLGPIYYNLQIRKWAAGNHQGPPPHAIKVQNLLTLADIFGINVLIETGTYRGHMIEATAHRFRQLYSIEVFEPLATAAKTRFARFPNVTVIHGDSSEVLPTILPDIDEPVLFWLDGHYSGVGTGKGIVDTPVKNEIRHILNLRKSHVDVVLIDDARCFDGSSGYPILSEFIEELADQFACAIHVADDAIIILPANAPRAIGAELQRLPPASLPI